MSPRAATAAAGPRRRWLVLGVVTGAQASFSCVQVGLLTVGPSLQSGFALSGGQVGLVAGAVTAGTLPALFAWGALADRIGERAVLGAGLALTTGMLLVAAQAQDWVQLAAALFATGAAGASVVTGTSRAVLTRFGSHERAVALGIRQSAIPVGGAVASLVLPSLVTGAGIGAALRVLAALVAVAGVVAVAVLTWADPAATS